MITTDILIAGGGLAGASLALLLAERTDFTITLVEAANLPAVSEAPLTPSFNARSTALSQGSLQIYQQLGMLEALLAEAGLIRQVDVSTRGYLGQTRLRAEEVDEPQLGAVIENRYLGKLLLQRIHDCDAINLLVANKVTAARRLESGYQVTLAAGEELSCRLLVVADGARSSTRELLGIAAHHEDTGEAALVVNVKLKAAHQGIAYERFLDTGPLAFLPLSGETKQSEDRMTVVWTGKKVLIDELMELSDANFMARLQEQARLLKLPIEMLGKRSNYPMILTQSTAQCSPFAVVVGNAAHTLHPVAAQGFNLTLRDLDCLSQCLVGEAHPGKLSVLNGYLRQRESDQSLIKRASGQLPDLFRVSFPPFAHARQLGLVALATMPTLRQSFTRRAMGLVARQGESL